VTTDTEALLTTVREALKEWTAARMRDGADPNVLMPKVREEAYALAALAAELERVKAERDAIGAALGEPCAECGHIDWRSDGYADALAARVKAERDEWRGDALAAMGKLDRALLALREIERAYPSKEAVANIITRGVIAEIEGEA